MTMEETWLYHYDPEKEQQSMEWWHSGSPRPKKFQCKSPLEKFSPWFFGIKTASSSLIIFQRVILRVDSLTLLKIINEENAVLIPKNRGEKFSSGFLHSDFFGGRGEPLCRHISLIVALSPGHSDITRFHPWSTIATGNLLDRTEKFPILLRRLAPLKFLIRVQAFRDPLRGELPHVQAFMNDGPTPLTSNAQLLSCNKKRLAIRQMNRPLFQTTLSIPSYDIGK